MKTIDMTPTWKAVLPLYLETYEKSNAGAREMAMKELTRMAELADKYVAIVNAEKESG